MTVLAYRVNRLLRNFGLQLVRSATLDRLQVPPVDTVQNACIPPTVAAPTDPARADVTTEFAAPIPSGWSDPIAVLRKKWGEVPAGDRRQSSAQLLQRSDREILAEWDRARNNDVLGPGFGVRGWYHEAYRSLMPGKTVLDIGCGMALSTLCFAEMGARVTFVDIVPENVELVRRLCRAKGISAEFLTIDRFGDLDQLPIFDIVTTIGSLINTPLAVTRMEVDALKTHLRQRGRWLHLAYPRTRWEQEGRIPFCRWGEVTDGSGTPWMEYHDRDKIFWLFEPSEIRILFECEWHNNEFNWFDIELLRH